MEQPAVSIIMPALNAESTIGESIETVLRQVFFNWELIVVDDGSTDNTVAVVNDLQKKDKRITLLKLPKNGGLSNARNEGCRVAKGEYITFLDSDDLWHRDKLQKQWNFHMRNPSIEISHTDFHIFNDNGVVRRPFKNWIDPKKHKEGLIYPRICYRNSIGVLTVMVKKELIAEVGFFDTTLWTLEDQDLWVRIAAQGKTFGYIPSVLAFYRLNTAGGITSKVGRYKRAYKQFISKLLQSRKLSEDLLFRNYYRHFGTVYFKKKQYTLATLYFKKSIALVPYDFISFSTLVYLVLSLIRQAITISR